VAICGRFIDEDAGCALDNWSVTDGKLMDGASQHPVLVLVMLSINEGEGMVSMKRKSDNDSKDSKDGYRTGSQRSVLLSRREKK
jgi:hypothetical protein